MHRLVYSLRPMKIQDRRFEVLCYLEESVAAFLGGIYRQQKLEQELALAVAAKVRLAVAEKFGGLSYYTPMDAAADCLKSNSVLDAREVFRFAAQAVAASLQEIGIGEAEAAIQADPLSFELTVNFQGQTFYLPRQDALKIDERNRQLLKEFVGTNQIELARKFGIGIKQVYKIIKTESMRNKTASAARKMEPSHE